MNDFERKALKRKAESFWRDQLYVISFKKQRLDAWLLQEG